MKIFAIIYFNLLKLRYNFEISWLDLIKKDKKYLIFPNHQALVDPQIVVSLLFSKIKICPVISETFYNIPVLKSFFKMIKAVSMWDIQKWTSNEKDILKAFEDIKTALQKWNNLLLYPSGQLYSQWFEVIKWKKSWYFAVKNMPKDCEIILIKTTWLWWSMFSKAYIWETPNLFKAIFKSIFYIIFNLIFFIPKRNVKIEISNYTKKLENIENINDFNQELQDFYNKDWEEEIVYLKHYFYFDDIKNKKIPKINWSLIEINSDFDFKLIPLEIKTEIINKCLEIKNITWNFDFDSNLVLDLYFDSIELAEIKAYIQAKYQNSSNPAITQLKTIWDLCIMAIWKSSWVEELKPCDWKIKNNENENIYESLNKNLWNNEYDNILSLFKKSFKQGKNSSFVYDNILWMQIKKDFLIKAYLISKYIKKSKWKYVWIMLPSITLSSLVIISSLLAWKIPVMLNWTLWESSLNHCIKFSKIENIFTSKNFYEKIKNDQTKNFENMYIFLEDLLKNVWLKQKFKALFDSLLFKIPKISNNSEAVILFTSWSESLPKAVSLSHKNIISDILWALYHFPLKKNDILMGFLPPFHSFGFSINTIMPLIIGLRVCYTPDPNDAKTIQNLLIHTKTTAITSTPTFLKMILNSTKSKLGNIKYAVVWAEKCPIELEKQFSEICTNWKILEWYWITECSPVISINPPSKAKLWSVWLPIYNSKVIIVSLENNEILWKNEQWMIYFSGKNVFNWYLDEKLESPFEYFNQEKYYKTWDLWYLDDDWYLFITWRLKRFVKIAWEMISLPFIENILTKKYSKNDTLSVAIEAKELNWNVKIVLFSTINIDLKEVWEYLRSSWVSNLVKISEIINIDEIPLLWTWKTDYKKLKELIIF